MSEEHVWIGRPYITALTESTVLPLEVALTNRVEPLAAPGLADAHLREGAEGFFLVRVGAA